MADLMRFPVILTLIGNAGYAVMFLLIGPAPFLNIETDMTLFQVMAGLLGTVFCIALISTARRGLLAAHNLGYANNLETTFAVSGNEYPLKIHHQILYH